MMNESTTTSSTTITPTTRRTSMIRSFLVELWYSSDSIFQNHLSWLLITGPIAILGRNVFSEAVCFTLAGMALIPCAERLSYVTEQVALHTNASIGALLNATFGNAPELLIASAAIRSGFYRLTQLTMLGSMITNMIFVFGLSCFVGGLRWQTQELQVGTGVIAMLLLSTAGSLIPAALVLSGHFVDRDKSAAGHHHHQERGLDAVDFMFNSNVPTQEEITLSRVNAAVMLIAYLLYLIFQLGTHVDEVTERLATPRPNVVCRRLFSWAMKPLVRVVASKRLSNHVRSVSWASRSMEKRMASEHDEEVVILLKHRDDEFLSSVPPRSATSSSNNGGLTSEHSMDPLRLRETVPRQMMGSESMADPVRIRETVRSMGSEQSSDPMRIRETSRTSLSVKKSKESDGNNEEDNDDEEDNDEEEPRLSMRVGIFWLFVVTMCISAMSDILVDTIDGFAQRMRLSQVFTSMVIIPFFSNIAEQVSSVIFGYRNEMDLCVGVTIGSAIQIATFVLPGSVLMAMMMDRSMTLYFHSYETVCWFFCTVLVSLILLSKTSNWLVGAILILTYVMFAAGIWYHEIENLSVDAEDYDHADDGSGRTR